MSKAKTVEKWPRIHPQQNASGTTTFYVDLRAVNGGRPGYPDIESARTRADQARTERANEGTLAFSLPQDVRLDAAKANKILSPHGVSILEVAKYYERHVLAFKSAPTVKEIVEKYIENRISKNKRPRTIADLKHRLNTFAADFGDRRISEISSNELEEWVFDDAWAPRTQTHFITKISQLYNFAKRKKWVDSNLAADIDHPDVDEATPEFWTVEESERLLTNAHDFGLLPFVAVGMFAGVRTTEMLRMDSRAINFETKTITILSGVAKKRKQRTIEMQPALLAWLAPCKEKLQAGGRVAEITKLESKEKFLEAAGIEEWKLNGLRHSFATYHFAAFENEGSCSRQMGNSPTVFHNHYKGIVTKDTAEQFWNLRPTKRTGG